jgi:VIT1/CCC1 family predicted Fe2+/Mn2+ transporter
MPPQPRPLISAGTRSAMVFGAADGVTVVLGLVVSLAASAPSAVVRAALGAGLAELVGMTAGQWLSDGESGFGRALANGAAALAGCFIPAVPYLFTSGAVALAAALCLVVVVGGVVAWLRPERGVLAVVQTYGILLAAAVLCTAAALV